MASSSDVADSATIAGSSPTSQSLKNFSGRASQFSRRAAARERRKSCLRFHGMRVLHRDSDVVGAIVLLVILLLTGIRALVM